MSGPGQELGLTDRLSRLGVWFGATSRNLVGQWWGQQNPSLPRRELRPRLLQWLNEVDVIRYSVSRFQIFGMCPAFAAAGFQQWMVGFSIWGRALPTRDPKKTRIECLTRSVAPSSIAVRFVAGIA